MARYSRPFFRAAAGSHNPQGFLVPALAVLAWTAKAPRALPAVAGRREFLLAAGVFHQNTAHGFPGRGEEISAVGRLEMVISHQTQPGFMHERGRLEGLTGGFGGHLVRRQPAQFIIDQWQQFFRPVLVPLDDVFVLPPTPVAAEQAVTSPEPAPSKSPTPPDLLRKSRRVGDVRSGIRGSSWCASSVFRLNT